MLVALREFSLGERHLRPGDEITLSEQRALPPLRIEQLKTNRYVQEQWGEQVLERKISELEKRMAKLEGRKRQKVAA